MNFKTTLLLLVLLLLAGGMYWYVSVKTPEGPVRASDVSAEGEGKPLFATGDINASSVKEIRIERKDGVTRFERVEGQWRQVEPVSFALDRWQMEQLIGETASLKYEQKLDAKTITLQDAGLSPAQATLTIVGDDSSKLHTLKFGKTLTIGGRGYVQLGNDEAVYIVPDPLHHRFEEKLADLRAKTLTAPTLATAKRITLQQNDQVIELIKGDGDQWTFAAPLAGRADATAIQGLLNAVTEIYIADFVSDNPAQASLYGLTEPQSVLRVAMAEGTSTLRIGAAVDMNKDSYFATWSTTDEPSAVVFRITGSDKEKYDKQPNDLRDSRLTPMAREDVKGISITRQSATGLSLVRSEHAWTFAPPGPGFNADGDAANALLDTILNARAESYVPDVAVTSEPLITATLESATAPDVLRVYAAEQEGRFLVVREGETLGYVVPETALSLLREPVLAFRDRVVLNLPQEKATAITIQRPDGVTYNFTRDEVGGWKLEGHDKFEAQAFHVLLAGLFPLHAVRWHAEQATLNNPLVVTFKIEGSDDTVLQVDPVSHLAQTGNVTGFEFDAHLIEQLDSEFRDRTVLPIVAADITAVTIGHGENTLTIRKDANGRFRRSDDKPIDASAGAALFDTLAGLRVRRYLGAGFRQYFGPTLQLEIELKAGEKRTLELWLRDRTGYLTNNTGAVTGNLFELSAESVRKLTALKPGGDATEAPPEEDALP